MFASAFDCGEDVKKMALVYQEAAPNTPPPPKRVLFNGRPPANNIFKPGNSTPPTFVGVESLTLCPKVPELDDWDCVLELHAYSPGFSILPRPSQWAAEEYIHCDIHSNGEPPALVPLASDSSQEGEELEGNGSRELLSPSKALGVKKPLGVRPVALYLSPDEKAKNDGALAA
jgi:hypothetical protein